MSEKNVILTRKFAFSTPKKKPRVVQAPKYNKNYHSVENQPLCILLTFRTKKAKKTLKLVFFLISHFEFYTQNKNNQSSLFIYISV
jgi:hypothetical protein